MVYNRPSYVPLEYIQKPPIQHEWSDWDPYVLLGEQREESVKTLSRVSYRANITYSIGCAEWVAFRMEKFLDDHRPFKFLEASWAFVMDEKIQPPDPFQEHEWQGALRGPVDLALVTILNTYYTTEDGAPEYEAAFAELLPLHVLDDIAPFENWRENVLERLEASYTRAANDPWGPPIPREILDPVFDFDRVERTELVRKFLSTIDYLENDLVVVFGGDNRY